jgi:hypothetical protein
VYGIKQTQKEENVTKLRVKLGNSQIYKAGEFTTIFSSCIVMSKLNGLLEKEEGICWGEIVGKM